MRKAVMYLRVSSKEQKEEGYSIAAQRKMLTEYARRGGFEVVGTYEEVETAKRTGRAEFGRMLALLKKRGDVEHVLVEKTDRLYRNFRDLVNLDDLQKTIHFVKEGQVIGPDARSSDKLMHSIKVAMAKNYVDNLSEETSKGMLAKAEQGLYPSFAPLGYVNDRETGIRVDFERARGIRELFEAYATGRYSLKELGRLGFEKGLRTRKGKRVQTSAIATMLRNPVYVGDVRWKGRVYEGSHEAIVRREVFDRVGEVLGRRNRTRGKTRVFAFRGLLTCGSCGCSLTAEIKKEKYVYYRCTRARGNCTEKPIREETLARLLGEPLKRIRVTERRLEWIRKSLRESFEDQKAYRAKELERLEKERNEIERKMDMLYEDKLSGGVSEDFWRRTSEKLQSQKRRVEKGLEEHRYAKTNYLAEGSRVLELAQAAYGLYVTKNPLDQRRLLDLILSNCKFAGGDVKPKFKKFFEILADGAAEEEKLTDENVPFEDRNKNWLPGRNPLRNVLCFLGVSKWAKMWLRC